MEVLITPVALAPPLHLIRNRSRNEGWNLWVEWCVSSWRPWFWPVHSTCYIHSIYCSCIISNKKALSKRHKSQTLVWQWWCVRCYDTLILSCWVSNVHFNFIVHDSLYYKMDKGTVWHCALVSCTPSQSIGLFFLCALFWCWVSLCAPFTIFSIEFYFIMVFIMIVATIIGIFMAILFVLNYTLMLSVTK